MKTTLGLMLVLTLLFAAGCVTGAVDTVAWQHTNADKSVDVLRFTNNKDNSIDALDANVMTGVISLRGLKSNGSTLGGIQSQTIMQQGVILDSIVGRVINALPLIGAATGGLGGGGIGGLITGGGTVTPTPTPTPTTQPASGTRSAAGQAIVDQALQMLADCPKFTPAQKTPIAALINSVPPGGEALIIQMEAAMGISPANVTPVPAAWRKP